ncbi:MAG: hypothetical protein HRT38_14505, partial [Alteromonadaceae bacterium]|nr:hypothetical protein [Alteromonadaceae bacterium]
DSSNISTRRSYISPHLKGWGVQLSHDVFAQQRDALSQQLALLGKTNELAKAEYATTQGKYKDLLPTQKTVLLNLAKEIDAKNKSITADQLANNQAKQLSSSANSYADTLQRKIALTGEASNVAQLNFELERGSLQGINDELRQHLELLAQKADATQALADQQLPFWEQMKEHISSTSQDFDTMWGNTFNNFAQGIGNATATAVMEGENFGKTMKNIARGAIKEVLSGLVQLGVKKLALFAIEKLINKGAAVSGGGVMTANAQASSLLAGINAFASTAAIPIVGPALAPGAMTAALAITTPMVAGVAGMASTMVGMAHDGITEIPREGTWLLDKGERVVDGRTNADLKDYLRSTNKENSSPIINLNVTATDTGGFDRWYNANRNKIIADVSDAIRTPA